MEKIKNKKNTAFCIIVSTIVILSVAIAMVVHIASNNNSAFADNGSDLFIEADKTDDYSSIKVSNIEKYKDKTKKMRSANSDLQIGKSIYAALGYSDKEIESLSEERLLEAVNSSNMQTLTSYFYIPDDLLSTVSTSNTQLQAKISSNETADNGDGEKLRSSMTLKLTLSRSVDYDKTETITNKDGVEETRYYWGVKVHMDLNWDKIPTTRLADKLFVLTDKEIIDDNMQFKFFEQGHVYPTMIYNNQTTENNKDKYREYWFNLPNGGGKSEMAYNGDIYFRGISGDFNFKVIYLHHTSLSVGFDDVKVNWNNWNIDVNTPVIHTVYESAKYNISFS